MANFDFSADILSFYSVVIRVNEQLFRVNGRLVLAKGQHRLLSGSFLDQEVRRLARHLVVE
jgi:hypothetical protein